MARPLWCGSLRFGLVHVPVCLHAAVNEKEVRFHLLHDADGARIQLRRICSRDGQEVPWEHVVKGYEWRPGHFVELTQGELEALEARASRTVDIEDFVPAASLDPVYYDIPYHLVPDEGAERAYALLAEALRETGRAGIGRLVLRGKGHLCAVRAHERGLLLCTLHWADELVSQESFDALAQREPRLSERELETAVRVVESMASSFEPGRYHDSHRERLLAFIERRARGLPSELPPLRKRPAAPADLLGALEQSLAARPPPHEGGQPRGAREERGRLALRRQAAAREARVRTHARRAALRTRKPEE